MTKFCECGCGNVVRKKFRIGHHWRNRKHRGQSKRLMSLRKKMLYKNGWIHPMTGKVSPNKNRIFSEEVRQKMSSSKIGEKNPMFGMSKELAPRWLNGKSFEPYTPDFDSKFKKAIKERDGCCMLCHIGFEDLYALKRRIHVHHINYNKVDSFKENCISLCIKCHGLTNHNRSQWTKFFQSLLSERYGYQYTEDQKIILNFEEEYHGI